MGSDRSSPADSWPDPQSRSFPDLVGFASYGGVAPIEVASADHSRHRLPRGGDRNLSLHLAALTRVRMPNSIGRAYYGKKIAAGRTTTRPCDA